MGAIKHKLCLLVILFLWLPAGTIQGKQFYRVKTVIDGDTIILEDNRRIRYIGIDSPEISDSKHKLFAYGQRAKKYNARLVQGKQVRLEFDRERQDRYGRYLAYVYLKNGTLVNKALIVEGLAVCYPVERNNRFQQEFLAEQQKAMKSNKGLWRAISKRGQARVGNSRSYRFHTRQCDLGAKISKNNRVRLKNTRDGYWHGYAPCNKCQPD